MKEEKGDLHEEVEEVFVVLADDLPAEGPAVACLVVLNAALALDGFGSFKEGGKIRRGDELVLGLDRS